jgi:hypothetical protein
VQGIVDLENELMGRKRLAKAIRRLGGWPGMQVSRIKAIRACKAIDEGELPRVRCVTSDAWPSQGKAGPS